MCDQEDKTNDEDIALFLLPAIIKAKPLSGVNTNVGLAMEYAKEIRKRHEIAVAERKAEKAEQNKRDKLGYDIRDVEADIRNREAALKNALAQAASYNTSSLKEEVEVTKKGMAAMPCMKDSVKKTLTETVKKLEKEIKDKEKHAKRWKAEAKTYRGLLKKLEENLEKLNERKRQKEVAPAVAGS